MSLIAIAISRSSHMTASTAASASASASAFSRRAASSILLNRPPTLPAGAAVHCSSTPSLSVSTSPFRRTFHSGARRLDQQQQQQKPRRRQPVVLGGGPPRASEFRVWPFVAIAVAGSLAFMTLVSSRSMNMNIMPPPPGTQPRGGAKKSPPPPSQQQSPTTATKMPDLPARDTPLFTPSDATVLFVLGGPGAGKGTQCARLVRDYHFTHLSAGDLLRAEQNRPDSQFGDLIKQYIRDGAIVPMEVTVKLLENAMQDVINNKSKSSSTSKAPIFLIDGFPRKLDQAERFEQSVAKSLLTLFFDCPEPELQRRLLERGRTSGRADDNEESIRKRFKTFEETSMPVVDAFEKDGRVVRVLSDKGIDEVYAEVRDRLRAWGIEPPRE